MDAELVSIVVALCGVMAALLSVGASIVWGASKIKSTVDTHGNAIGELKRRMDAHERSITEHHGRLARLEGWKE